MEDSDRDISSVHATLVDSPRPVNMGVQNDTRVGYTGDQRGPCTCHPCARAVITARAHGWCVDRYRPLIGSRINFDLPIFLTLGYWGSVSKKIRQFLIVNVPPDCELCFFGSPQVLSSKCNHHKLLITVNAYTGCLSLAVRDDSDMEHSLYSRAPAPSSTKLGQGHCLSILVLGFEQNQTQSEFRTVL